MSENCRTLIELAIENKFNEKLYKMLNESDLRHFDYLVDTMGWEHCHVDRPVERTVVKLNPIRG
jgi:hypothetical protein